MYHFYSTELFVLEAIFSFIQFFKKILGFFCFLGGGGGLGFPEVVFGFFYLFLVWYTIVPKLWMSVVGTLCAIAHYRASLFLLYHLFLLDLIPSLVSFYVREFIGKNYQGQ